MRAIELHEKRGWTKDAPIKRSLVAVEAIEGIRESPDGTTNILLHNFAFEVEESYDEVQRLIKEEESL